jgi:nitrate reductase cytochrome c-type subunit
LSKNKLKFVDTNNTSPLGAVHYYISKQNNKCIFCGLAEVSINSKDKLSAIEF